MAQHLHGQQADSCQAVRMGMTVIGIITMKSQNENLNYALPISEYLNAPENTAAAYMKLKYSVPIFFDYFTYSV